MADLILNNTYLILLLPLWIFLIIMGARFFAVYINNKVIYSLTLLSSFSGILLSFLSLFHLNMPVEQTFQFIKIGNFIISCGVQIDKLSVILALVLFIVSFVVQLFSISYMKNEPKNYRFFAYLNMFNFAMAGLLFSPNLFQMYFFWELVGIMSYLLIGFDYKNILKSEASRRVFLMNRVGDTALIAGILVVSYLMYNYSGNYSFNTLNFQDMNAISTLLSAYTSTPTFGVISGLFIIAAAVKSAQFPFYTWLQDAMEAKLPVSALLHSATMVVAGVFLIIRLLPIFSLNNNILLFISLLGILTALICSVLASIETHPKKVLAYSTSSNLGLMFLSIGLLNIRAGLIFLVAHALTKSMLFLSLDNKDKYVNYITFLIGGLSLAGLLFSGVVAKEFLFSSMQGNVVFQTIYCVVAFLTAFYIMRISVIMIQDEKLVKEFNFFKFLPLLILLLSNIVFYFYVRTKVEYEVAEPYWLALLGWGIVYILFSKGVLTKYSKTPKLLEKFYNNNVVNYYNNYSSCMNWIEVNVFSNYKPILLCVKLKVKFVNFIEVHIMNGSVNFVVSCMKKFSELYSKMQTKNVQNYNAYALIFVVAIISFVIFVYKYILSQIS